MDPSPERINAVEQSENAVGMLRQSMDVRSIPPGGMSIVYAIRGARDPHGVAGVTGRITVDDKPRAGGPVCSGR